MSDLAQAYVQIIPKAEGITGKLENLLGGPADTAGQSAGGKWSSAFGGAAKAGLAAVGAGVTAATAGVVAFGKSAVDAGMSFDSSMSQVAATMGVSVAEIGELRDFAMEMGASTAFSASEAADALNYMALAGYDATESMTMLPNVLNLAAAGGIELGRASDMITDAQTALGISFDETSVMVDQMAAAAANANTSVGQLGDAILSIGGTAQYMAGGTLELNTVLGALGDNGIKGAEAGTHLRNIILSLMAPTDTAADALKALGVSALDAEGNMRPMEDVMGDLNDAMADMSDGERAWTISAIFNKTDIASVNALLGTTAERWEELSGAISDSAGAAGQMADTQLDNLAGDVTLFQSALEGAKIAVSDGLTPTLRQFVQFGSAGLSTVTEAFQEGGLSGAMDALGGILSDGISMIIEMAPTVVEAGMQFLGALGQGMLDNMPMILDAMIEIGMMILSGLVEALPGMADAAVGIILTLADGLTAAAPQLIAALPTVIVTIVDGLLGNMPALVSAGLELILALAQGILAAIPELIACAPQLIASLWNGLLASLPTLQAFGGQLLSTLLSGLNSIWGAVRNIGTQIVQGIWQGLQNAWANFRAWVMSMFSNLLSGVRGLLGIASPSKAFAEIGGFMAEGLTEGILSGEGEAVAAARSVAEAARGAAEGVSVTLEPSVMDTDAMQTARRRTAAIAAVSAAERTTDSAGELVAIRLRLDRLLDLMREDDRAVQLEDGTIVGRWTRRMDTALGAAL